MHEAGREGRRNDVLDSREMARSGSSLKTLLPKVYPVAQQPWELVRKADSQAHLRPTASESALSKISTVLHLNTII